MLSRGFPDPLPKTLGIWSEEIDSLHDGQLNYIEIVGKNKLGLSGELEAYELCDLIHLKAAEAIVYYKEDFYAGRPALTVNEFGEGKAHYIASRNKAPFHDDFLRN